MVEPERELALHVLHARLQDTDLSREVLCSSRADVLRRMGCPQRAPRRVDDRLVLGGAHVNLGFFFW